MNISRRRALSIFALLAVSLALAPIWQAKADAPVPAPASPGPKAIFIIRHAEKPDPNPDKDPDLTPRGVERATALVHVIPDHFCTPDFIIATADSAHSNRPRETVTPLAKSLKLDLINSYATADIDQLAHDLLTDPKYAGKTILICWHHEKIPDLAKALGADAPKTWASDVFDRVWVLTFSQGHVTFADEPQKALPSDSQK
jgi:phosphohistidine phosphatase SixA